MVYGGFGRPRRVESRSRFLGELVHALRIEIPHAFEVAKRAFALIAWAALDVDSGDLRDLRERRRVVGRGGTEQRDQRPSDRGPGVPQPPVLAPPPRRQRTQSDRP